MELLADGQRYWHAAGGYLYGLGRIWDAATQTSAHAVAVIELASGEMLSLRRISFDASRVKPLDVSYFFPMPTQ